MNILVCGAHGFVGQAFCDALARDGHRVLKGVRVAVSYTHLTLPTIYSV